MARWITARFDGDGEGGWVGECCGGDDDDD